MRISGWESHYQQASRAGLRTAYLYNWKLDRIGKQKLNLLRLLDDDNSKLFQVICGLITDGRSVVSYALKEAQNYRRQYGETIPLKILNERLSSLFHAYTLYSAVRPFGVCVILTTWTEQNGAEMYCIEPSGVSFGYFGCATGKAKQAAKTEIEKLKLESLSTRELLNEASKIIFRVNEDSTDSDTKFKLELSWVGKDTNGIHQMCPLNLYEEAKASATAAMEQGDSDVE